jgi:protein involved in polysaccharide export with SLBB domain
MKDKRTVLCLIVTIFAVVLFVSIAAHAAQQEPANETMTPEKPGMASQEYTIEIGDEFDIKSYYNPELNEHVIVRPDGRISLPLINEIQVVGKTPEQLATELTNRYSSEFKQPQVSVILRTFGAQKVYVAGQVNKPGMINLVGPLTALQAVALAEGFTDVARTGEVVVIRRGQDNRPVATTVDLKSVSNGSDPKADLLLQPYDIVYVPRSRIGNVNRWVNQYIRQNIPIPFSFSYRLDNRNPIN